MKTKVRSAGRARDRRTAERTRDRRAGALLGVAERVSGAVGSGSTPVELRFEPR